MRRLNCEQDRILELRNDGWESGQPLTFQQGFVSGEIAAVRLVPNGPCPCPVTRVRFLLGGAQTQQTITLRIWDDSLAGTEPGAGAMGFSALIALSALRLSRGVGA